MTRILFAVIALAALTPSFARADADSAYDNEVSRRERDRLFPHAIRNANDRLHFIVAIIGERAVGSRTVTGVNGCGVATKFVQASMADGRECTSPAPTSCESRTVTCE